MLNLYVMRHAKSSWEDPELSDYQRPLNKRGSHNAKLMKKIMKYIQRKRLIYLREIIRNIILIIRLTIFFNNFLKILLVQMHTIFNQPLTKIYNS